MADFCRQCSVRVFGEDSKDFDGLCQPEDLQLVLCEGCGYIWADHTGKCLGNCLEPTHGGKIVQGGGA